MPGATPKNCGNYHMHNLEMAQWYASEFVNYLQENCSNENIFNYPTTEKHKTENGLTFYDS